MDLSRVLRDFPKQAEAIAEGEYPVNNKALIKDC